MTAPVLLEAAGVGKRYCRSWKRAAFYALQDGAKRAIGRRTEGYDLRRDEFWAVREVSFQLRRGECLGILGPNGAGKSTLLKMLSGTVLADRGKIRLNGRINAMLEVGGGLQPLLTGRENIQAFGAQQGVSSEELAARFDELVAFAELEEHLDKPVKQYSSGMQLRLGFALLAHFPGEVILLDEVLAVSDARFRAKCLNRIPDLMRRSAVVFVSHTMPQVARVATSVLVLDRGRCAYQGDEVPRGIDAYYAACEPDIPAVASGNGRARLHSHCLFMDGAPLQGALHYGHALSLEAELSAQGPNTPTVSIILSNPELHNVVQCDSLYRGFRLPADGRAHRLRVDLGPLQLNPGLYFLSLTVADESRGETLLRYDNFAKLRVAGEYFGHAPVQLPGSWSLENQAPK